MKALLIPIYEPTDRVVPFLKQFQKEDFDAFLVVNDGSGKRYDAIFKQIEEETIFSVIGYDVNYGKGYALKHGMRHLIKQYPDLDYIVTADGDGQHLRQDILKVSAATKDSGFAIVLGYRDFSQMPPKSVSGNIWSARYFYLCTHVKIKDCQTGLRVIPKDAFDMALYTYGHRFDYEMNFLLVASREFGIYEVPIMTVYEDGNKGTHFRPVADSLLIMRTPIAYIIVGVLSFLTDLLVFYLLAKFAFTDATTNALSQFYCHFIARAISFPFNYMMLEFIVFHHSGHFHNSLYKYLGLAIVSFFTNFGLTYLIGTYWPALGWVKAIVGVVLAIAVYFVNLLITFANRKFRHHQ